MQNAVENFLADMGYFSGANVNACEGKSIKTKHI